jgi:hypothetical protein
MNLENMLMEKECLEFVEEVVHFLKMRVSFGFKVYVYILRAQKFDKIFQLFLNLLSNIKQDWGFNFFRAFSNILLCGASKALE